MSAQRRTLLELAGALLAFVVGAGVYLAGGLSNLEAATLQTRFELRSQPHPANIVIVGIDQHSLDVIGHDYDTRYPFPRSIDARAVD